MTPERYRDLTRRLLARADADPDVVGLVALGSMAAPERLDRWSDHDFFWIVRPGEQERYRRNLEWLPDAGEVVFAVRETAHGLKVLYAEGHLLEFAVFDLEEIHLAKVDDYEVLLDRGGVGEAMAEVAAKSAPGPIDPQHEMGMFLALLQVGTGRHARGEHLSAHALVKTEALRHLLRLLTTVLDEPGAHLDPFDPLRRFESAHPEVAAELHTALGQDTPACARTLLALADQQLTGRLTPYPTDALTTLRHHLSATTTALDER